MQVLGIMEKEIDTLKEALKKAERVVVLTGAGISAKSGVPTFEAQAASGKTTSPLSSLHLRPLQGIPNWSGNFTTGV